MGTTHRLVEIARAPVPFDAEQPGARLPRPSPRARTDSARPTPRAGGRNSFQAERGLGPHGARSAPDAMRRSPRLANEGSRERAPPTRLGKRSPGGCRRQFRGTARTTARCGGRRGWRTKDRVKRHAPTRLGRAPHRHRRQFRGGSGALRAPAGLETRAPPEAARAKSQPRASSGTTPGGARASQADGREPPPRRGRGPRGERRIA